MILLDIKKHMQQQQVANLSQLAAHFRQNVCVMEKMLAHWVRKGVIRLASRPSGCGSACQACRPEWVKIYQFID